ncbi:MAG: universal stress protein [Acidobacteriota bacterium]
MEIRRILHPTDFSEASKRALPHALHLAKRCGGELILAHIRTPYSDDPNRPEFHFVDEGRYSSFIAAELERAANHIDEEIPFRSIIERDVSPANGILRVAEEEKVDVIVMGTHGRSALAHFFLGSVAERVVRYAEVPVLTVASKRDGYRDRPEYQKILTAFDFSPHSQEAARWGYHLARLYGAEFKVLYVIEQEIHPGFYDLWKVSVSSELPNLREKARQALLAVLGRQGLEEVEVVVEIGVGDGRVHRDLTEFARREEIDLLVMGTYGLTGFEHALLGSTTERMVRIAPCPVLAVHRHPRT